MLNTSTRIFNFRYPTVCSPFIQIRPAVSARSARPARGAAAPVRGASRGIPLKLPNDTARFDCSAHIVLTRVKRSITISVSSLLFREISRKSGSGARERGPRAQGWRHITPQLSMFNSSSPIFQIDVVSKWRVGVSVYMLSRLFVEWMYLFTEILWSDSTSAGWVFTRAWGARAGNHLLNNYI